MFGVQLHNVAGGAKQDIVLPICYRNTPWALTVAHSIGFGIYRKEGLVQLFHDSNEAVWKRLGYTLLKGTIEPSHRVALTRSKESAPDYFFNLIKDTQSIETKIFDNVEEQATWVANQIEENLKPDELEPGDILVIFPNPLSVTKDAGILREKLRLKKLSSHIAGVTSSRDKLFLKDSIAITGIFRAKGNEAPMVYVLNSEYGEEGSELIKKRNTIFTAITRSKAWVRICGCGPAMEKLKAEIDEVIKRDYQLEFTVPTEEQLAQMKKIYREITTEDRSNIEKLKEVVTLWEKGDLPIEVLPKKLRERLKKQLEQLKEQ